MNTELKKKLIPIRKAVRIAWEKLPKHFHALTLCNMVRSMRDRPTMDGTILRQLRKLRSDGIIDYKVVDNLNSLYEKRNEKI